MYIFDYEQANLIQNFVGPALANAGLDTNVWAYDHNNGDVVFEQAYYAMARFSKFIPKGAIVLSRSRSYDFSNGSVQSVASLNLDGSRTVVIENTFGNDVYVTLKTNSGQE